MDFARAAPKSKPYQDSALEHTALNQSAFTVVITIVDVSTNPYNPLIIVKMSIPAAIVP